MYICGYSFTDTENILFKMMIFKQQFINKCHDKQTPSILLYVWYFSDIKRMQFLRSKCLSWLLESLTIISLICFTSHAVLTSNTGVSAVKLRSTCAAPAVCEDPRLHTTTWPWTYSSSSHASDTDALWRSSQYSPYGTATASLFYGTTLLLKSK